MKKVLLAAVVLGLGVLLAPGPAAAHWSISFGFPVAPVIVAPPPCPRPYYPYPVYYGYPYGYPPQPPYVSFGYYDGPGLHRYGYPHYFDDGPRYGDGWNRRKTAFGYTLR
jgi:hypothetical protein